ncbi:MAG: glycosyltransferase family 2 protein [Bacteroidaceae bacterium]|nr:glycosyltransferase family 2 protein [Bacteroidaceae bacterium]
MNKVSVIIPIFNVEKFLCRALDSLLVQSHQDWEAIMVDDGSTDHSVSIAQQYLERDKRFILITQENQGQAVARNNALKIVSGDYVMYLDPDDMFHPQAMEICVNASLRDNSDMVTFTYDHFYRTLNKWRHRLHLGNTKPRSKHYKNYSYFVTENIFEHATESTYPQGINRKWKVKHCQAWRCLLKTDLARKARFAEGVKYEDVPWWGEILLNVKRTTITKLPLYYYYPNPDSFIMSAGIEEHIRSLKVILKQTDELFEKATPKQRNAWNANFRKPYNKYLEKKQHQA